MIKNRSIIDIIENTKVSRQWKTVSLMCSTLGSKTDASGKVFDCM